MNKNLKKVFSLTLKILLAYILFLLTFYIVHLIFYYGKIQEFELLKWFIILNCFAGFYASGFILRNVSIKIIPILYVQLIVFVLLDDFYFPFNLVLILFASFALFLTRNEFKKRLKLITSFLMIGCFMFFLFSQPLVVNSFEEFTTNDGNSINEKVIWDFTNQQNSLPDLTYVNSQNENVELLEFQNKKLVITYWGTWCGPCIKEKPELEKLKKINSHKKDIVFIDIATDDDFDDWLNYLNRKTATGHQLFSNNYSRDKFAMNFTAFPYRIVVNEDGIYKQCRELKKLGELLSDNSLFNKYINP